MKRVRLVILLVALACGFAGRDSQPVRGARQPAPRHPAVGAAAQLRGLKSQPVPLYFLSYTVHDTRTTSMRASFGALQRSDEARSRQRVASVEVRVGDYALDNTHPLRGDTNASRPRVSVVSLPLTDDPPIRLALWRATDRSFKQAAEALTRVKTNVAAKIKDENPAPDFSREEPQTYTGAPARFALDTKAWEARLRRISAPFADDPFVFDSDVSLSVESDNRYYTNSEGSQVATGDVSCRLFIQAMTKADDGMELPLYASYFATIAGRTARTRSSYDRRPRDDGAAREASPRAARRSVLRARRSCRAAPPASSSTRSSATASKATARRTWTTGRRSRKSVDQLVLPPFLSVVFDPTLRKLGNIELMGHYLYDDEGVKARRVTVVDKGVLKTFLLGRAPLLAFPQSNGHGRAQPGYLPMSRQSNLIVESTKTVTPEALIDMLREEARKQGKPFGLLFENIEGGFTFTSRSQPNAFNVMPNVVYRIYTDGRPPELVRGVDLIGTPLAAFGKIVATSDKVDVFNGICGAESGSVPVSASAPSLLVSEVEVQKKAQSQETLPILPAPQPRKRS